MNSDPAMPSTLTRFSVAPLHTMTRALAAVAMGRAAPDLVLTGARVLSTYTERIHRNREVWIKGGRIAAVKPAGAAAKAGLVSRGRLHDVAGGIVAPGLVDPHVHIESSMMTACAFAEAALRNGTTTVFCDSHEIGNVCDTAGVEWMLEDARRAPLSVYLTVPSTVPAPTPRWKLPAGILPLRRSAGFSIAGPRPSHWGRRWITLRSPRVTNAAMPSSRRRSAVGGRSVATFTVGSSWRPVLPVGSPTRTRRSTAT